MNNPPAAKLFHILKVKIVTAAVILLSTAVACSGGPSPGGTEAVSNAETPASAVPATTAAHNVNVGTVTPTAASRYQEPATPAQTDAREAATSFPVPPDRDYLRLASQLIPGAAAVERAEGSPALALKPGHRISLKLVDLDSRELYENQFELRLVTPRAYWFFEDGVEAEQEDIERSATEFEEVIYPSVTGTFGSEWNPGVDGDPHLYIINAHLRGAGGYFSAADEYPREIRPVSNEIEAIYINARYLPVGTERFAQVLAHELQHAVHWNADLSDETWVNEGLSELAVSIAGYPEYSISEYRRAGPTSLTQWPANNIGGMESYGAASLFMHYLTEHYGSRKDLRPLLEEPADGIPGIDAYLAASGHGVTFRDVFRDWAVANLLDEDEGLLGYDDLSITMPVYQSAFIGKELLSSIPQYSNEYVRLGRGDKAARLVFEGESTVPLLPIDAGEGCWWSNSGDVIDSTLTARLDLKQVDRAVLQFDVWYSIEEDWDFAYLEVSEDEGSTWTILETPLSSTDDPLSVSFGPGYTGATDGWQRESVPLESWTGQEILVRFQYITDAAIQDHGLCLRNLRVTEGTGARSLEVQWDPNGFAWTNNLVRQDFFLQVVYEGDEGTPNRIVQVELDDHNRGEILLDPAQEFRRIVAIVQPMAPATRMPASYTILLEEVE